MTTTTAPARVVVVPGVLALLPEYAGQLDPVADLRAACLAAVAWLGAEVTVLADDQGVRVADHLLAATDRAAHGSSYLVVGNGSACRTGKAPGFLDPRAADYDDQLRRFLRGVGALPDPALGRELLAAPDAFGRLAALGLAPADPDGVRVDYDDDPFGVQYWVTRWTCGS